MDSDPCTPNLLAFLSRLSTAKIHFELGQCREEAVLVLISVPGERWEVEFFGDGSIEVERFHSNGKIGGPESIEELFTRFSD